MMCKRCMCDSGGKKYCKFCQSSVDSRVPKVIGYNCYPGEGWKMFGDLVINFTRNRVESVYFHGEPLFERS